jgi:hypothetical protein
MDVIVGTCMQKAVLVAAAMLCFTMGCQTNPPPRLRVGTYFGSLSGTEFADPLDLGRHCRTLGWGEKNGLVYTCRGGFIDMAHLREAADRTAYVCGLLYPAIMHQKRHLSFQLIEPSRYHLTFEYPDHWRGLSHDERQEIAYSLSVKLGQYIAQKSTVWHEILTWFGFSSTGVFSEYLSSFSWEDVYSDLLGTRLAVIALNHTPHAYDDAMTLLIQNELQRLGMQPPAVADQALQAISGAWYTNGYYFFSTLKKRNFDLGHDDGLVTPWLVPGICPEQEPLSYPVPTTDILDVYGFSMQLEIEPRELEGPALLSIAHDGESGKCIEPSVHFPILMSHIRKEAEEQYGPEVGVPSL